jgi:predicted site-specific integrase-resolvase
MSFETTLPKRKLTHPKKAEQQGVSGRTLDRWVEQGRIDPPDYVNGRKYYDEDSQPRTDSEAA